MPIGPGVDCEMATMSVNIPWLIQPLTVTTWPWMRESIAPPPPKLNRPMKKKVVKSCKSSAVIVPSSGG